MNYVLRDLRMEDLEGMLEIVNDPLINCFYTDDIRKSTRETIGQFIENAAELKKKGISYHYAISDSKDEYIGTISLKNVEKVKGAEYAIIMRRGYQGMGIATWATREILQIAFRKMALNRVYLNVLSDNLHANRFYIKNRFRYEGESKMCICIEGKIKSLKWYAMLAEEYRIICNDI